MQIILFFVKLNLAIAKGQTVTFRARERTGQASFDWHCGTLRRPRTVAGCLFCSFPQTPVFATHHELDVVGAINRM
jgi:hypothetical protein